MQDTQVHIRDHVAQCYDSYLIEEGQIAFNAARWSFPEPLLLEIRQPLFHEVESWADLDTAHYHVLLGLQIALWSEHQDDPVRLSLIERGLCSILASLIFEIGARMDGQVRELVIHRLSETQIEIELSATLMSIELPPHNGGLKIVVDNSK